MRIFLLCSLINCIFIFSGKAQTGINTNVPVGVFHIDGGIVGNTSDDVVIDNLGRMGIGTTAPTNQLHIKAPTQTPSLSLRDGNQEEYKMLVSDAQGVGTWGFIGLATVKGVLSPNGGTYMVTQLVPQTQYPEEKYYPMYPLDGTITLPPGRWAVYSNFQYWTSGADGTQTYASNTWIRLAYSDSYGGALSVDVVGGSWTSGLIYSIPYGTIQGISTILNTTSSNKTYYLGIVYANQGYVSAGIRINNLAGEAGGGILAVKIANN